MAAYHTFTRTWWKDNPAYPDGLEPHAGKKTPKKIFDTEAEARDWCREWNRTHKAGRYSFKAEFEKVE